jgi:cell division transport system permease protein
MRLIGATDIFIKVPFYVQGLIQGALGGIGGLFILFAAFTFITSNFEQGLITGLSGFQFLSPFLSMAILSCSMVIGWLGCFISLKQFLKS